MLARRPWRLAVVALLIAGVASFGAVWTNTLGFGDRFDRFTARVEAFINPPPDRPTLPTIVVTPRPSPTATPEITPMPATTPPVATPTDQPTPSPSPLVRAPVDVTMVANHEAVFASQLTTDDCAVAGTQMVLTILGLGNASAEFQTQIKSRIGEWESLSDSLNGGWGPAAIAQALAAYGARGYEVRAYDTRADALRDSAIALSSTGKPVVLLPWWGAHTWVMTGYRADADPTLFPDAVVSGLYILDPWYPRVSSIWGPSDPPGTFQDAAEMERNFIGWTRPEGAYPDRDGRFLLVAPTIPREGYAPRRTPDQAFGDG